MFCRRVPYSLSLRSMWSVTTSVMSEMYVLVTLLSSSRRISLGHGRWMSAMICSMLFRIDLGIDSQLLRGCLSCTMYVSVVHRYLACVVGASNLISAVVVVGRCSVEIVVERWSVVLVVGSWSVTSIDPVVDCRLDSS